MLDEARLAGRPLAVHAEPEPIAMVDAAVVCRDRTRAAAVASTPIRAARHVTGGMVDWLERGYPIEKRPARD